MVAAPVVLPRSNFLVRVAGNVIFNVSTEVSVAFVVPGPIVPDNTSDPSPPSIVSEEENVVPSEIVSAPSPPLIDTAPPTDIVTESSPPPSVTTASELPAVPVIVTRSLPEPPSTVC